MVTKFNIQTGETFTVTNPADYRFGRTYTVIGFDADKFGRLYCVCELHGERGYKSSHIFFSEDFA